MGKIKLDANLRDKLRYLYLYIDKLNRVEHYFQSCNLDKSILSHIYQSRATTSQLIFFILNEEISHNNHRKGLETLFVQLGIGNDSEDINHLFKQNSHLAFYTKDLFRNQFNPILVNYFFDYVISMWTSFEFNISNIYEKYKLDDENVLNESQFNKFRKFFNSSILNEIELSEEDKTKIKDIVTSKSNEFLKKFPKYISSDDKINFIFKLIQHRYTRDINKDKETIHFLRTLRNTHHNNGIHLANDLEVEIKGEKFIIKKGTSGNFDDDINFVKFYIELLEIYVHIISALPFEEIE